MFTMVIHCLTHTLVGFLPICKELRGLAMLSESFRAHFASSWPPLCP